MKICLDAGHGLYTQGKQSPNGVKEAEQNYPIMLKVAEYLRLNGIDAVCTNTDIKNDMSLQDRVKKANASKADIFISIHKNAITGVWQTTAKGIESFVYKKGSDAERLANKIHKNLIADTKMQDRKVKEANFYVLKNTSMPAVLLELGFMDFKQEADQMKNAEWQDKYSRAITKGICEYFGKTAVFKKAEEKRTEASKNIFYRVIAGSFTDKENAERQVAVLKTKGVTATVLKFEK
jgi:N-acetylmuramoyl-L-alanine amidase